MSRAVKFTMAFAVLLVGATVALVCPRSSSPTATARSPVGRQTALRPWSAIGRAAEPSSPTRPKPTEASPVRVPRAMIRAAIEKNDAPPGLAREFPRPHDSLPTDWVQVPDYGLPQPADSRPATRIHKVADGDTLALLAERYLGSADRADEIFDLNRDVLSSPGALPLGVELRIPPRAGPAVEEGMLPEPPLVPVRPDNESPI